jgi:hypothetical protein
VDDGGFNPITNRDVFRQSGGDEFFDAGDGFAEGVVAEVALMDGEKARAGPAFGEGVEVGEGGDAVVGGVPNIHIHAYSRSSGWPLLFMPRVSQGVNSE